MNISTTSEYSSGCESGWTMYLDQLSNHNNDFITKHQEEEEDGAVFVNDQNDDEDLSMVSDASSGPPHLYDQFHENINCGGGGGGGGVYSQYYGYYTPHDDKKKSNKLQKSSKLKETNSGKGKKQQNLNLDDTASSPVFYFSQDNVPASDFSQVLSTSHFEDKSMTKKQLDFFKSSTKGKSSSWLGRKRH